MEYDDNYDNNEQYDNEYDDLDSAADDWEEEAQQIEDQERADQRARELQRKRQLAVRAAKRAEREKKEEEVEPLDFQKEADMLRQDASSTEAAASAFNNIQQYIADMPFRTVEDAQKLGETISKHIATQKKRESLRVMLSQLYVSLCKEFSSVDDLTSVLNVNTILLEKVKRDEKIGKRRGVDESRVHVGLRSDMEVTDGQWGGDAGDDFADEQAF